MLNIVVLQTLLAVNTFRFAIFPLKEPYLPQLFIHAKIFKNFLIIFVKKDAAVFELFKNRNTKMLTNFVRKIFYYIKHEGKYKSRGLISVSINRHNVTINDHSVQFSINQNRVNRQIYYARNLALFRIVSSHYLKECLCMILEFSAVSFFRKTCFF